MSSENDAPVKESFPEEAKSLDQVKARLIELEKVRANQGKLKTAGLCIIAGLFAFIVISLYSSYSNFKKEEYNTALKKELNKTFSPRWQSLRKKLQGEIIPLIKENLTSKLNARVPAIEKQILSIGKKAEESMKATLANSLEKMLKGIEEGIRKEVGDETFSLILDNDQFEKMVAEEIYAQIAGSEDIVERFRVEIEYLKINNPELAKMAPEKAEKLFITSVLDLMKYKVDPEMGKSKKASR